MSKWVWNSIGLAIVVFVLMMTWRIFGGSNAQITAGGITAKVENPPAPVSKEPQKIDEPGPISCRLPEHGVERWEIRTETVDSGWRKGGSSPAEFCAAQQTAFQKLFPKSEILLAATKEQHKSEYNPFKRDYYLYTCTFEIRDPVYHLAPNKNCE